MVVRPAAGPLTLNAEPLKNPTTTPPTTPAIIPEKSGAPDANATPKQSGKATRNTTTAAGRSCLKFFSGLKFSLLIYLVSPAATVERLFTLLSTRKMGGSFAELSKLTPRSLMSPVFKLYTHP